MLSNDDCCDALEKKKRKKKKKKKRNKRDEGSYVDGAGLSLVPYARLSIATVLS